ncbi:MAG TPA: hypothetical protein VF932_03120 [Anaerolineae bacterium]
MAFSTRASSLRSPTIVQAGSGDHLTRVGVTAIPSRIARNGLVSVSMISSS